MAPSDQQVVDTLRQHHTVGHVVVTAARDAVGKAGAL